MRRRTGRNTRADSGHGEGGPGDEQEREEEHKGWQGTRDRIGVQVEGKERQGEQDGKEENLRAGRRTRVMQGGRGGEKNCLYTYNIAS